MDQVVPTSETSLTAPGGPGKDLVRRGSSEISPPPGKKWLVAVIALCAVVALLLVTVIVLLSRPDSTEAAPTVTVTPTTTETTTTTSSTPAAITTTTTPGSSTTASTDNSSTGAAASSDTGAYHLIHSGIEKSKTYYDDMYLDTDGKGFQIDSEGIVGIDTTFGPTRPGSDGLAKCSSSPGTEMSVSFAAIRKKPEICAYTMTGTVAYLQFTDYPAPDSDFPTLDVRYAIYSTKY